MVDFQGEQNTPIEAPDKMGKNEEDFNQMTRLMNISGCLFSDKAAITPPETNKARIKELL